MTEKEKLNKIDFWSRNPCGTDGKLYKVMEHRYRMEPWLQNELETIPTEHERYLEIGCGQGADSFYICKNLNQRTKYSSIDYSFESVRRASSFIDEAKELFDLNTIPEFILGNALSLSFNNKEFDFIFSLGVLHHTPDPQKAIDKIYRVLKWGGQAKIFLYRKYSLKVGVAKFLRLFQAFGDKLLSKDRFIYTMLNQKKSDYFGSMFLECFGVPWMKCYSRSELENMFKEFGSISIEPYGFNLPIFSNSVNGHNALGYFFKIDVTK
jgi:ubiquinone/menaquinone biosynthesis C-methylase UbiE